MNLAKYWTLEKIALAVKGDLISGKQNSAVQSISIDSRSIKADNLFWAIEGRSQDGNNFAEEAAKKRARGAVVSRDFPPGTFPGHFALLRVRRGLPALGLLASAHRAIFEKTCVVAVTGSNGKTTTKEMIGRVLAEQKETCVSAGNFNNEVGCPLSLLEINAKHGYGVFELAARQKGDIEYLTRMVRPHIAVITNVSAAHLATFKTIDNIFEAKSEILKGLTPRGLVIYWAEDLRLCRLPSAYPQFNFMSFGLTSQAQVRGEIKDLSPSGSLLDIFYKDKREAKVRLQAIGSPNCQNALAAFACGLTVGVSVKKIIQALEEFKPAALRGEIIPLKNSSFKKEHTVLNDAYNANPASMKEGVLNFLKAFKGREKIVVLGEMRELGDQDAIIHEETVKKIVEEGAKEALIDSNTSFIFVGGALARAMAQILPGQHFDNRGQASQYLKITLASKENSCALYFKASRAEKLETIIGELCSST